MAVVKIESRFEPAKLRANRRNETIMYLTVTTDDQKEYWCQCDILVNSPLSLAHDKELNAGRTMVGIIKPNRKSEKQIKLYTRPNNFPDAYKINITAYLYDEDGAIAERLVQDETIMCEVDDKELQNKQG